MQKAAYDMLNTCTIMHILAYFFLDQMRIDTGNIVLCKATFGNPLHHPRAAVYKKLYTLWKDAFRLYLSVCVWVASSAISVALTQLSRLKKIKDYDVLLKAIKYDKFLAS
jgi:hypothetical protein